MSSGLVKDSDTRDTKCSSSLKILVVDINAKTPLKGSLAYDVNSEVNGKYGSLYYADGSEWIPVLSGTGNNLIAGSGINITADGTDVTISAQAQPSVTLTSA